MEALRQKEWGCGLGDRDVVALWQVDAPMMVRNFFAGSVEMIVVLMTPVHLLAQLLLKMKSLWKRSGPIKKGVV